MIAAGLRVGMTLPCFVDDPEIPVAVARSAEAAGLDGVFAFDHLLRVGPAGRSHALECFTLLGAVAAETSRGALGPLVARATLRHAAVTTASLDTLQRVSGGRVIAALGAGDCESAPEEAELGLAPATAADRIDALRAAVTAAHGRGYPVWVGGGALRLREVIAGADGWNRWGGSADGFARDAARLRSAGAATQTLTWAGQVVLDSLDSAARALRAYAQAGAQWVIVAPVDSSDPMNAEMVGGVAAQLRRG